MVWFGSLVWLDGLVWWCAVVFIMRETVYDDVCHVVTGDIPGAGLKPGHAHQTYYSYIQMYSKWLIVKCYHTLA